MRPHLLNILTGLTVKKVKKSSKGYSMDTTKKSIEANAAGNRNYRLFKGGLSVFFLLWLPIYTYIWDILLKLVCFMII